jgi:hypothetical protein
MSQVFSCTEIFIVTFFADWSESVSRQMLLGCGRELCCAKVLFCADFMIPVRDGYTVYRMAEKNAYECILTRSFNEDCSEMVLKSLLRDLHTQRETLATSWFTRTTAVVPSSCPKPTVADFPNYTMPIANITLSTPTTAIQKASVSAEAPSVASPENGTQEEVKLSSLATVTATVEEERQAGGGVDMSGKYVREEHYQQSATAMPTIHELTMNSPLNSAVIIATHSSEGSGTKTYRTDGSVYVSMVGACVWLRTQFLQFVTIL